MKTAEIETIKSGFGVMFGISLKNGEFIVSTVKHYTVYKTLKGAEKAKRAWEISI